MDYNIFKKIKINKELAGTIILVIGIIGILFIPIFGIFDILTSDQTFKLFLTSVLWGFIGVCVNKCFGKNM